MKTQTEIQTLKQISIERYLADKGIFPVSKSGVWLMYHSPLREDHTASFGVNTVKNIFNDLGSADKGNIIELVMKLKDIRFVDACRFLESEDFVKEKEISKTPFLLQSQDSLDNPTKDYQVTAVKNLQHPALIRYVESRKISFQNACKYLNEIHYINAKGKFFGVGYQKDSSGYVVRSGIMKKPIHLGNTGIKTFAVPNSKNVAVFEGMFDFLSACEFYKVCPSMTVIILNSTSNLNKALPIINEYEKVFCYLDNDDAGYKALDKLKDAGVNIFDCSHVYKGFNDFNEFLTKK